jgi:nicotinate-nucleotide adenylyltransferase
VKTGIMGGTFNPIHYGHLLIAEEVRHIKGLDRIVFIPAAHPPHKREEGMIDIRHRYQMAVLATSSNPHFAVSDLEMKRPGPSYTVDTVEELSALCPREELYFIMGSDAFSEIDSWREVGRLMTLCRFIVVDRKDRPLKSLKPEMMGRVDIVWCLSLNISASDIRMRIREGKPVKYLLPEKVEEYIHRHKLYVSSHEGRQVE